MSPNSLYKPLLEAGLRRQALLVTLKTPWKERKNRLDYL